MNNPNEIIEFLKSYYNRKPMVGTQTTIAKIEDLFLCKKTNKAHNELFQLALTSYENHSRPDLAKEICEYLQKEDDTNFEVKLLITTLLIQERSFLLAEPKISELLLIAPDNKQLLELQIELHTRLRHKDKQKSALSQYLHCYPQAIQLRFQLADLLICNEPLAAFETLIIENISLDSEFLLQIASMLYSIEEYDLALVFLNEFKLQEPLQQNSKHLGTRIKLTKPENIFRFFIDQSEIRSYADTISLTPDQYHFQFEDLNNNLFETFTNLKDGWDYQFDFNPEPSITQTHFVQTSKFKMKYDIVQQHKEIKVHLKKFYPKLTN